jgi:succinate dehydrogenase / fumarate reductase cytochrome b subunit
MTWGWHLVHKGYVDGQPYHNLYQSFSTNRWPVAVVYIVANIALGLHLYHGAWSLFQSLGWSNPRFNPWRRRFAQAFAAVIVAGNVSIPVAGLLGIYDQAVAPATAAIQSHASPGATVLAAQHSALRNQDSRTEATP